MGEALCECGVGHGDSFGPDGGQGQEVVGQAALIAASAAGSPQGRHRSRCGCAFGGGHAISSLKRWS